MKALLLALPAIALAAPASDISVRATSPPPDQIKIIDSSTSGNGCPQGTVSTTMSPDSTVVTFGFDAFQAYIGPGTTPADKSKNCQLHLSLKYPGGFQYSVLEATYHGYARLDAGVTANFYSTYFFSQDASKTGTTKATITGKDWVNGNIYTKADSVESTATIWSPCGETGILNINNRIALTSTAASQSGEISDDDATVAFTQQMHVSWRPCTPGSTSSGGDSDITLVPGTTTITHG